MNGIDAIIARLEQQKAAVDRALAALREMDGSSTPAEAAPVAAAAVTATRKGGMTPEGKARLVAALKKRWAAKKRAAKRAAKAENPVEVEASAPAARKSGMTPEGRKRLADSMKRRWAAKRVWSVETSGRKKTA